MKKNIEDGESPRVRKVFVGFWVEEDLGVQLKDAAWERRKTLSELLRDYCRAALRHEPGIKNYRRARKENHGALDSQQKSSTCGGGLDDGK